MIGSTVLSMGLWLMSYYIVWMFIGCGLRDLAPLVGSLSVFVTVRVYAGDPSAIVFLLGYFLVVWFVGSLCEIVSRTLAVILASVPS